jgi:hypothetical protein
VIYTSFITAGVAANFVFTVWPLLTLFFNILSDKMKKGEVGGACSIREAMRNA